MGCWRGFCLEHSADLHMVQMPLPLTISCFSKIQIGFTFLVAAHPVVPDKGPLNGCVCVSFDAIAFGLTVIVIRTFCSENFQCSVLYPFPLLSINHSLCYVDKTIFLFLLSQLHSNFLCMDGRSALFDLADR